MLARLRDCVIAVFGLPCFAALRLAQEYSIRRELAKIDVLGEAVSAEAGLVISNAGRIRVGRNVSFGAYLRISCYPGGSVDIGDNVVITSHCVIAADRGHIVIGSDTLIAPGVSIVASNHGLAASPKIRLQPNTSKDINIGSDVWLGKGVAVVAGSRIAEGCIIGANAVVLESTESYGIYAGVPIRKIGERRNGSA